MDEADRGRQPPACVPWRELPLTAALRVLILEDPPELTSDLIPIGNGSSAELTVAQTGVLWVFANDLVESLWQQHRRAAIDRYASRKPVRPVLGTRRGRAPRCRRCPGENATMIAQRSWCSVAVSAMVLSGCTQLHVTDCPDGQVLGKDVNRFRTASYRTTLDNPPAAAKRFLVLAAMSGLAYWHEGSECPHEDQHLTKQDADELKTILRGASPDGAWEPVRFDPALNLPTEAGRTSACSSTYGAALDCTGMTTSSLPFVGRRIARIGSTGTCGGSPVSSFPTISTRARRGTCKRC
jgi:hypothetical protein